MRNYYVEPTTVVAVAQAAYKLWSAAQGAKQTKEIIGLLKEINIKLDTIIRKQDQILAELKAMQIQFRLDLRNEFIRALEVDLFALQSELNVEADQIGVVSNRQALADIARLAVQIRPLSFRFLGYGLPAFTGAIGSALLLSVVYGLMRQLGANVRAVNAEELSFLNEWDSRLAEWLKPDSGEGITAAIVLTQSERRRLEEELQNHPRKVSVGWFDTGEEYYTGDGRECDVYQERILAISGDLQTGYSDVYELGARDPRYRCRRAHPNLHGPAVGAVTAFAPSFAAAELIDKLNDYDPERPFDLPEADKAVETGAPQQSYYANAGYLAFGSFEKLLPVNHPITQAMNAKRAVWLEVLERESNLMSLLKIMTTLTDRLRTRTGDLKAIA